MPALVLLLFVLFAPCIRASKEECPSVDCSDKALLAYHLDMLSHLHCDGRFEDGQGLCEEGHCKTDCKEELHCTLGYLTQPNLEDPCANFGLDDDDKNATCDAAIKYVYAGHTLCEDEQLPDGLETKLHDYEFPCEDHLCNAGKKGESDDDDDNVGDPVTAPVAAPVTAPVAAPVAAPVGDGTSAFSTGHTLHTTACVNVLAVVFASSVVASFV